ncbi:phage major capsid protein [Bradyrhizobium sp. 613_E4_N2_2]|uniref:phage major capsid protein n=1 Tax=Bradyrhizobium sp. 613_E4_N2_2 TaxID=3240371 RepID=UPI003F8BD339
MTIKDKAVLRLQEIRAKGTQRREATVVGVDVEARTVELSFSSEIEYERWWGIEILGHDPGECDLSRLNDNAALLWNHNWDDMRGKCEPGTARIEGDRKGRVTVRFANDDDGEKLLRRVEDGIVTKVSVGYTVNGIKLVEERDGVDVFRVTAWMPFEVSLVSVPADATVGVGRSAEIPPEETRAAPDDTGVTIDNPTGHRKPEIMIKVLRNASGDLVRAEVDENGAIVRELETLERAGDNERTAVTRGADAERTRVRSLLAMGREYGDEAMAAKYVEDGKTPEDLQRALLAKFADQRGKTPLAEQERESDIGMSDKDVRQFSIMRALRHLADPSDAAARKEAGFEIECSRAAADKYGKSPKGIIIPADVLSRAFSTTTPVGGPGSNIVATELLSGSFIELLRKKAWVMKRARTLGGLIGNVSIPRQNGTGQVYWVGEGNGPTAGQPSVDQIAFTPKTMGAKTEITRRLLMQSTPDAEALVRDDLLKIMALELDRVAIYGSGSANQPKGMRNITGINAVDFATAGKPTFEELVAMETQIALDDADVDSMSYAFNAAIRGYMKTALKFPTTAASGTIWEQGNTVNGYATNVSNQVATGEVLFGNWNDLIIAMWGGLELTVDPYALSDSGGLKLVALQDIDVNIRHVESFCIGSDTVA